MEYRKRILICPLDWGLGHASRCIPLIRILLEENYEVIIAADKLPGAMLQLEFPHVKFLQFAGYNVRYSKNYLWLKLFFFLPRLAMGIFREHRVLAEIIKENNIDLIISDNRYGCWSKKVPSIFITHQLYLKVPIFETVVRQMNFWFLNKYDQVWIPDIEGEKNYSGSLSHGNQLPQNAHYIGILSRFSSVEKSQAKAGEYKICVLLSGPEPQRTLFEEIIIKQLNESNFKAIVLRGMPEVTSTIESTAQITFLNHANGEEMESIIASSELIISRSGYSTIMDLASMGKKAVFVPTPGQTEQAYLAKYFMQQGICFTQSQSNFNLKKAIDQTAQFSGFGKKKAEQSEKTLLVNLLQKINHPTKR